MLDFIHFLWQVYIRNPNCAIEAPKSETRRGVPWVFDPCGNWAERSTTGRTLTLDGEAIRREPGVTYRLGVNAAVTNSAGQTETITVYSSPVECP